MHCLSLCLSLCVRARLLCTPTWGDFVTWLPVRVYACACVYLPLSHPLCVCVCLLAWVNAGCD
jgi:hypothetical protein